MTHIHLTAVRDGNTSQLTTAIQPFEHFRQRPNPDSDVETSTLWYDTLLQVTVGGVPLIDQRVARRIAARLIASALSDGRASATCRHLSVWARRHGDGDLAETLLLSLRATRARQNGLAILPAEADALTRLATWHDAPVHLPNSW